MINDASIQVNQSINQSIQRCNASLQLRISECVQLNWSTGAHADQSRS